MSHKLKGHDPLQDKKFRTLTITGKTAKLKTATVDDRHTAMLAYKEFLDPPKIEKEVDLSKADPIFLPPDYQPPKKAGGKRVAIDPDNPKYKAKNDKIILKNRHQNLMDIGLMNFNKENSSFVTLTVDPNRFPDADLNFCYKAFKNFIRSLKNHYTGIAYIVVFERNTSPSDEPDATDKQMSRYHIHILWNIININRYTIDKYWHRGLTDVKNDFDSVRSILLYMGKTFRETDKFQHAFNYSQNLHTATIYRETKGQADEIDRFMDAQQQANNIKQVYDKTTTTSKYVNEIEYEYYHLTSPHTSYMPVAKLKKKSKNSKKNTNISSK